MYYILLITRKELGELQEKMNEGLQVEEKLKEELQELKGIPYY